MTNRTAIRDAIAVRKQVLPLMYRCGQLVELAGPELRAVALEREGIAFLWFHPLASRQPAWGLPVPTAWLCCPLPFRLEARVTGELVLALAWATNDRALELLAFRPGAWIDAACRLR